MGCLLMPLMPGIRSLFKSFMDTNGISGHHVRSYDSRFGSDILQILHNFAGEPRKITRGKNSGVTLQLNLPWLEKISDDLARIRSSVEIDVPGEAKFKVPDVAICSIPIMAGSELAHRLGSAPKCPVGSFMVTSADGHASSPKAILMHEQVASNFLKYKIAKDVASVAISSFNGDRRLPVKVSIGVHRDSTIIIKNAKNPLMLDELVTKKARKNGLTIDVCVKGIPKSFNLAVFVAACCSEQNPEQDGLEAFCKLLKREIDDHDLTPTLNAAKMLLNEDVGISFTCRDAWKYMSDLSGGGAGAGEEGEGEGAGEAEAAAGSSSGLRSLICEAFPHIRSQTSLKKVAEYSAYLALRLTEELVVPKERTAFFVGKDHTGSKRYEASGELLMDLLNQSLRGAAKVLSEKLRNAKRNTHINEVVKKVTDAFKDTEDIFWNAVRTGKWYSGVPCRAPIGQGGGSKWLDSSGSWQRQGVCQAIPLDSPVASISLLRRIISPLANAKTLSKVDEPRMIDPMSMGKICPAETPDGSDVGLKKNMALSGTLSVHVPGGHEAFAEFGLSILQHSGSFLSGCRIFVDGDMLGVSTMNPEDVATCFRKFRALSQISSRFWRAAPSVQVSDSVFVWTDAGRIVMPVVVKGTPVGASGADWSSLVSQGKALLMDASEEACVDLDWDSDAVEAVEAAQAAQAVEAFDGRMRSYSVIYSHGMLGCPTSLIPFSKHNQAPRLQFSGSMMKQAVVADGHKYRLDYRQQPLVQSKSTKFLPEGISHTGQNVMAAVMIDPSGYAQEDALIYKKDSLDRGLFSMTMHQDFEDIINGHHSLNSPALCGRAPLQKVGEIKAGDIILPDPSVVAPLRGRIVKVERIKHSSASTPGNAEDGKVTEVQYAHTVTTCVPEDGDKFTSRHGQKGVIARKEAAENMPFDEDGNSPDLIINPHAFPSRMTEGQHIEGVIAAVAAAKGLIFEEGMIDSDPESVIEYMRQAGFVDGGKKTLRCGRTGRSFQAKILIAPVYYNRLNHIVANKARVRGHGGSLDPLTQQPAKGRKNGGGVRFGEMEYHATISQGANEVLKDRTGVASFMASIEEESGTFMYDTIPAREFSKDNTDEGPSGISNVRMPYGTKLLFQEMEALGIRPMMHME